VSTAIPVEIPDTTSVLSAPTRALATAYTPNLNHPVLVTVNAHLTVAASQEGRMKIQTMISGGALAEVTALSPRLAVPAAGPTLDVYIPVTFIVQPGGSYQLDQVQVVGSPTVAVASVSELVL
jgi:hypothetical protein